jgi:GntR family transcriptional regulator
MSLLVREPIYHQLTSQLRRLIVSGECSVGEKFLTERQVCDRFGVSRATSNKALSNLVSEGVLEFRKGIGTFVRGRPLDYNLRSLVSFTEEATAAGKQPSTLVLQFERMAASDVLDEVPELLQVGPQDELFYVERLRCADSTPVILERRYIVSSFCPDLSEADVGSSIYRAWIEHYQLHIEGADESIRGVNVRGADARALQLRDGAAGMLVRSVGYLTGHIPLWSERTLYRGDAYEFHNRLGPIQQAAANAPGRFL